MTWINNIDDDSFSKVCVSKDLFFDDGLPPLYREENESFTLIETKVNFRIKEEVGSKNWNVLRDNHMVRFIKRGRIFTLLPKSQKDKFIKMCEKEGIGIRFQTIC